MHFTIQIGRVTRRRGCFTKQPVIIGVGVFFVSKFASETIGKRNRLAKK